MSQTPTPPAAPEGVQYESFARGCLPWILAVLGMMAGLIAIAYLVYAK